jgi:hypothetical protein
MGQDELRDNLQCTQDNCGEDSVENVLDAFRIGTRSTIR